MIWTLSSPAQLAGVKFPLVWAGTALAHVVYTAPNPPPKTEETARYTKGDPLMQRAGQATFAFTKLVHWTYAVCESAVLIANTFPSSTSTFVLSLLVREGHSAAAVRPTTTTAIGWGLLCVGGLIRAACYRELGRLYTFHLSIRDGHRIVDTGPYGVVRHPGYTAAVIAFAGMVLAHFGEGSWFREAGWLETRAGQAVAAVWFANVFRIIAILVLHRVHQEDEALRSQMPEQWKKYAQRTPYRLIPFVY
ncbi:hypothetical protein BDW22DRAFT_1357977 [Trametopsis cervina]|nr:hypothetical protein BDW22DRAFT_1357977 [Trametopsis cervina]